MSAMPMRRKKWTEEEEEALISKYGELLQSGFLSKAKSRERKFEPMAAHVNALFHAQNPVAYPWLWSWKDASTKVQNMRHQYLGVKQKIRKVVPSSVDSAAEHEEYEWGDGLSIWSNFLKYKSVFGDQETDANEFLAASQAAINPSIAPQDHCGSLHSPHLQEEHQHISVHPHQHLSASPSPFVHTASFSPERGNSAIHSLPKGFTDTGPVLSNSNADLLLECQKDVASTVVNQVVINGEPGDLPSGLGFDYHGGGEGDGDDHEHVLKHRVKEYDVHINDPLDFERQKRQRQCGEFGSRLCNNSVGESQFLAFIAAQFMEFHDREARREEREMERQKERERRQAFFDAERLKQMQEWERERREMEEARRREAEGWEAKMRERELKCRALEQQRESMERERQREREEKMERERMAWREKMETRAMEHQTSMMQMQMQIAQCLQNSLALLSGAVSQVTCEGNHDVTGQPSSNSPFLSQLLQNFPTHGTGAVQYGVRRGTGESSNSHFDVDG